AAALRPREERRFVVESKATVAPGVDDLVRRARTGGRTVGDVDTGRCAEIDASAGVAVGDAAPLDRVDVVAGVVHREDVLRLRPVTAAVVGLLHRVRADAGLPELEVRVEEIDHTAAVGPDVAGFVDAQCDVRGG